MRLHKMMHEGATQKEIAEATKIPASAINLLARSAKGVGPTTAAAFVSLFGFESRGALVDAADKWYAAEGRIYAAKEIALMQRARHAKVAADAESDGESSGSTQPPKKRSA